MAFEIIGNAHTKWSGSRDEEGNREYVVTYRLRGETTDGPAAALSTPGLPLPGSFWAIDNDLDLYAYCTQRAKVTSVVNDEPSRYMDVELTFSTKPPPSSSHRCQDAKVEDPLLEPPKVSGSFVNYNEEATHDRFNLPIINSAHEQVRGPQVEFSKNRPRIVIEQNIASPLLAYVLPAQMQNTVNMFPLWGFFPRMILLAEVSWERKFYGQCYVYYTRKLTFDVDYQTFDRDLLDEGSKCLHGHWSRSGHWVLDAIAGENPDQFNPAHFSRFKDRNGENCRVILNGAGLPSGVCVDPARVVSLTGPTSPPVTPQQYISRFGPNVGHSLLDPEYWIPKPAGTAGFEVRGWFDDIRYTRGRIVYQEGLAGTVYICLSANTADRPPSANWEQTSTPQDRGVYSATRTYAKGDVVSNGVDGVTGTGTGSASCERTLVGNVHVEYYTESNFLLLGIPLIF